jgi:hypothetical protein
MVVFGFGRDQGAKALLHGPERFLVGFYDRSIRNMGDHQKFKDHIERLIQMAQE